MTDTAQPITASTTNARLVGSDPIEAVVGQRPQKWFKAVRCDPVNDDKVEAVGPTTSYVLWRMTYEGRLGNPH